MLMGGEGGEGWEGSCCKGLFGLEGSRPLLPFRLSVRTTRWKKIPRESVVKVPANDGSEWTPCLPYSGQTSKNKCSPVSARALDAFDCKGTQMAPEVCQTYDRKQQCSCLVRAQLCSLCPCFVCSMSVCPCTRARDTPLLKTSRMGNTKILMFLLAASLLNGRGIHSK